MSSDLGCESQEQGFGFEYEYEYEHEYEYGGGIGRVVLIERWGNACRCFATLTFPADGFLGLASEAFAWHCFAIRS